MTASVSTATTAVGRIGNINEQPLLVAYADPPYIGCAHIYRDHPDYAGEVDHVELVERLCGDYPDGVGVVGEVNEPRLPTV